jgi:hypothetical protein
MVDIQCCTLNTINLPVFQPSLLPTLLVHSQVEMLVVTHLKVAPSWTRDTCFQNTVTRCKTHGQMLMQQRCYSFSTRSLGFSLRCFHVRFVVDKWHNGAGLIPSYFKFLLLVIISSLFHTHLFPEVFNSSDQAANYHTLSLLSWGLQLCPSNLAGHWVRNFGALWGGTCNTWSEQRSHGDCNTLCLCSYVTAEHATSQAQEICKVKLSLCLTN